MPKFFVLEDQIKDETIYIIGNDVNHIANVLRLKKGSDLLVCSKETNITYRTKIDQILKEKVVCQILGKVEETSESKVDVTIFQGLPKAEKMELIIQKSTELGVKNIVPVTMKRCVVKLDGKDAVKKIERWQKIAEVAAKQSGRDAIPQIEPIIKLDKLVEKVAEFDAFIIAYENEKETTLKQILQQVKEKSKTKNDKVKLGILIGPEGGIDSAEIDLLVKNGAKVITLGNRILRTETASLTILSNIIYEYEL